ncbi:MAG: hypothetical protein M1840_004257 [Geoglossum simile]|nr:MAG: hypothetical protein M1840_004257 [Geoglossum simile]
MVGCLLLGIVVALLHHFYYRYLNGKAAQDHQHQQQWASRIGIGLAFVTKMFLALAVAAAYTQCIWKTARRKFISLNGLDAMFSATSDATAFLTTEMGRHSSSLLALIVWLIPIAAVITPSTLSIEAHLVSLQQTLSIPKPDFTTATFLAVEKQPASNSPYFQAALSMSASDTQTASISARAETGEYNGPNPSLGRLAMTVLLTGDIRTISAPLNASYNLGFHGPSINCDFANVTQLQNLYPNGTDAPEEIIDYKAAIHKGDPWSILVGVGAQKGGGVVCRLYNASYNVSFEFTSGRQVLKIIDLELQRSMPLPNPKDTTDRQISNYRAFMDAFTNVILGVVSHKADPLNYTIGSSVLQTELSYGPDLHQVFGNRKLSRPNLTLKAGIEELWQNYTLSLFSSDIAADLNPSIAKTPVEVRLTRNIFVYDHWNLLLAYGIAVFFAVFSVCFGIHARLNNQIDHSTSFSAILRTTRNPRLDSLVRASHREGQCLGRKKLVDSLGKSKLKFGVVIDEQNVRHAAWVLRDSEGAEEKLVGGTCPGDEEQPQHLHPV